MPVPAWRLQGLKRLADDGLSVLFQRSLDSAAAQYAGDCPEKYFLFIDECLHARKESPCTNVQQLVRACSQPLLAPTDQQQIQQLPHNNQNTNHLRFQDPKQNRELPPLSRYSEDCDGVVVSEDEAAVERRLSRLRNRDPRTLCPRCKSTEHITMQDEKQERSADEGGTPYRKCENPDCGYKWCTITERM